MIEVEIEDDAWMAAVPDAAALVERIVRAYDADAAGAGRST